MLICFGSFLGCFQPGSFGTQSINIKSAYASGIYIGISCFDDACTKDADTRDTYIKDTYVKVLITEVFVFAIILLKVVTL